jgi:hypothetical protein
MRLRLSCLGLLACVACGSVSSTSDGGSDSSGGGGSFALNATPTSIDIPIASSGVVTISIDRTGSVGDVTLSAQNLPAGITATFATNPVPAGTSASDVTFTVAPGSPAGSSNVTIVGTAGGSEKTVTVTVNAQTITVSGTVRGARGGVMVRIVGKAAVTSGTGGTFTFTDVSPPYDIYTVGTSGIGTASTPTVFYYQGLTRPDPIINAPQLLLIALPLRSQGTITGTKSGNTDTTNPITVVWDTGGSQTVAATAAYSFTAFWPNAMERRGTLFGFQFSKKVNGAPDAFTGYGSINATVTEGMTSTVNLVMPAPATAALTGTITSPSGFPVPTITLTQQVGTISITLWTGTTTAADATIPLVSAGKAALSATATLDGATTRFVHPGLAAPTAVGFDLRSPSLLMAPLNAAVNVTATTPFMWSAAPTTVYEVTLATTTTMGTAKARYQLYTTSATGTIPVVPELALPSNQSFTWNVNGYGPNANINDAASEAGLEQVSAVDFDGALHWTTNSTDRTFTTAP